MIWYGDRGNERAERVALVAAQAVDADVHGADERASSCRGRRSGRRALGLPARKQDHARGTSERAERDRDRDHELRSISRRLGLIAKPSEHEERQRDEAGEPLEHDRRERDLGGAGVRRAAADAQHVAADRRRQQRSRRTARRGSASSSVRSGTCAGRRPRARAASATRRRRSSAAMRRMPAQRNASVPGRLRFGGTKSSKSIFVSQDRAAGRR